MKAFGLIVAATVSLGVAGCDKNETAEKHTGPDHILLHDHSANGSEKSADAAGMKTAVAILKPSAAATTRPTQNDVTGTVTFTQTGNVVTIVAHVTGLKPNSSHGFHIHEKGDLSAPDLTSAGGHFNPGGHQHGGPDQAEAHAGDLGNIKADASGNARLELKSEMITLGDGANSVIGKPVIVHATADDLKTDPAGNAGARIAGGIIEISK